MTEPGADDGIDWSFGTWDGSRRAQLRAWCRLTLRERLEAIDAMHDLMNTFARQRAAGLFRTATDSDNK